MSYEKAAINVNGLCFNGDGKTKNKKTNKQKTTDELPQSKTGLDGGQETVGRFQLSYFRYCVYLMIVVVVFMQFPRGSHAVAYSKELAYIVDQVGFLKRIVFSFTSTPLPPSVA